MAFPQSAFQLQQEIIYDGHILMLSAEWTT